MKIHNLYNANHEQIISATHEKLVFDNDGVRLSTKLAEIQKRLDKLDPTGDNTLLDVATVE